MCCGPYAKSFVGKQDTRSYVYFKRSYRINMVNELIKLVGLCDCEALLAVSANPVILLIVSCK